MSKNAIFISPDPILHPEKGCRLTDGQELTSEAGYTAYIVAETPEAYNTGGSAPHFLESTFAVRLEEIDYVVIFDDGRDAEVFEALARALKIGRLIVLDSEMFPPEVMTNLLRSYYYTGEMDFEPLRHAS